MTEYLLKFKLISDAAFGRGDGVAGLVDQEVQHDEFGCPYLGGKALRGLLEEECANILYALSKQGLKDEWLAPARHLFGTPGSNLEAQSILHIGDACLPTNIRDAVKIEVQNNRLSHEQVLESLTTIRYQTAVDPETEAPKDTSLRSIRVILRETPFEARLIFSQSPDENDLLLLAACINGFRRAGMGRNRGRGELTADLCNMQGESILKTKFDLFSKKIKREA